MIIIYKVLQYKYNAIIIISMHFKFNAKINCLSYITLKSNIFLTNLKDFLLILQKLFM